jgi:hypothetical protein
VYLAQTHPLAMSMNDIQSQWENAGLMADRTALWVFFLFSRWALPKITREKLLMDGNSAVFGEILTLQELVRLGPRSRGISVRVFGRISQFDAARGQAMLQHDGAEVKLDTNLLGPCALLVGHAYQFIGECEFTNVSVVYFLLLLFLADLLVDWIDCRTSKFISSGSSLCCHASTSII